jgi:large subunit ribosomal protein L10
VGRNRESKEQVVAKLKDGLKDAQLAVVINYQGLSVAEITDLRNRLRPLGGSCKVTKNTLMGIAIKDDDKWQPMQELLKDSTAFLLIGEDIGSSIKAYKEFQKVSKKTELRGGVMEGRALTVEQVEALADLPSKEQLYGQIAGAINALATKLAFGIKEVPASVARGIKAVSEKDAA